MQRTSPRPYTNKKKKTKEFFCLFTKIINYIYTNKGSAIPYGVYNNAPSTCLEISSNFSNFHQDLDLASLASFELRRAERSNTTRWTANLDRLSLGAREAAVESIEEIFECFEPCQDQLLTVLSAACSVALIAFAKTSLRSSHGGPACHGNFYEQTSAADAGVPLASNIVAARLRDDPSAPSDAARGCGGC